MTDAQKDRVRRLLRSGSLSCVQIADRLGVPARSVAAIKAVQTLRAKASIAAPAADLPSRPATRRNGAEPLVAADREVGYLLEFWQWCDSDLLSNSLRGRFAEYLVALDLGVADGVRQEWQPYDLSTRSGIKVEVKSASYIQSWKQRRDSTIVFDVRPTLAWDPDTALFA